MIICLWWKKNSYLESAVELEHFQHLFQRVIPCSGPDEWHNWILQVSTAFFTVSPHLTISGLTAIQGYGRFQEVTYNLSLKLQLLHAHTHPIVTWLHFKCLAASLHLWLVAVPPVMLLQFMPFFANVQQNVHSGEWIHWMVCWTYPVTIAMIYNGNSGLNCGH